MRAAIPSSGGTNRRALLLVLAMAAFADAAGNKWYVPKGYVMDNPTTKTTADGHSSTAAVESASLSADNGDARRLAADYARVAQEQLDSMHSPDTAVGSALLRSGIPVHVDVTARLFGPPPFISNPVEARRRRLPVEAYDLDYELSIANLTNSNVTDIARKFGGLGLAPVNASSAASAANATSGESIDNSGSSNNNNATSVRSLQTAGDNSTCLYEDYNVSQEAAATNESLRE